MNFKKGFLWFLIFKLFLVTNVTVISLPGLPLLTVEVFMTLAMLVIFYTKRNSLDFDKHSFPYKIPFIWIVFSWTLSTLFAYIGIVGAISMFVGRVLTELVIVWLMWLMIKDKKDILFLVKWITIAFIPITIYAFVEKSVQANPIVEYESTLVIDTERAVTFVYDAESERGYRVQSVFEHAIGAGINWAMYIILVFMLLFKYNWKSKYNNIAITIAILSVPCLLFTNSRAPIVFLGIGCLAFFNLKNYKFYRYLIVAIVLGGIALPFFSDFTDNILSIFDTKAQEKVGGSNVEMRFEQLNVAITLMQQSPIVGFGFKFLNQMNTNLTRALLGMESMWFLIMTQFGMLGLVANIILCYYSLITIPRRYKSRSIFYISLAYWVTASMTSVPGMLIYMYYMIIIIIIKLSLITSSQCHKYQ